MQVIRWRARGEARSREERKFLEAGVMAAVVMVVVVVGDERGRKGSKGNVISVR